MPILDGRRVPASAIDPARHRFIGMWRPPEPPAPKPCPYPVTDPLFHLWRPMDTRGPWREGHYDEPQYVTHRPLVRWDAEKQAFEPQEFTESQRHGNRLAPMPEVFPNEPESTEPTEFCGNCRFFTDHKEAPGECRAHPTAVEKFSFHWCGEWEPR